MEKRLEGNDAYCYRTCWCLTKWHLNVQTSWNVHESLPEGFVDVGCGCIDGDIARVAKNVLVLCSLLYMVLGSCWLATSWYWSSKVICSKICCKPCFEKLCEHGIECVAVVCDGSCVNQSTLARKHRVRGVNWPPTFSSVGSINVVLTPHFFMHKSMVGSLFMEALSENCGRFSARKRTKLWRFSIRIVICQNPWQRFNFCIRFRLASLLSSFLLTYVHRDVSVF